MHNWDFRRFRVSNFSAQLLDNINEQPVFDFNVVNAAAIKKVRALGTATSLRLQLNRLRQYLRTCRGGTGLLQGIEQHPHLAADTTLYSMHDVRGGGSCGVGCSAGRAVDPGWEGEKEEWARRALIARRTLLFFPYSFTSSAMARSKSS